MTTKAFFEYLSNGQGREFESAKQRSSTKQDISLISGLSTPVEYVSLFSGCGGLDLGLESTGLFKTKLSVELEPSYFSTLEKNKGRTILGHPFLADAEILNADVFSDQALGRIQSHVRRGCGVVAGPPCQSFSSLGHRRGTADQRGNLTWEFFKLICDLKPPFFLFENVPPLGQKPAIGLRSKIFDLLNSKDCQFHANIVNMADYGCFTKRKRFIIFGSFDKRLEFPLETHAAEPSLFQKAWRPSKEALEDIPDPYSPNDLSNHDPVHHTEAVRQRFKALRPGEYDYKRHRSKLDPLAPGPTLVAGGNSGYVHHIHWDSRELTSRESARLHGFPDEFKFGGSKLDVAKQIANSIPIEFGQAFARALHQQLLITSMVDT